SSDRDGDPDGTAPGHAAGATSNQGVAHPNGPRPFQSHRSQEGKRVLTTEDRSTRGNAGRARARGRRRLDARRSSRAAPRERRNRHGPDRHRGLPVHPVSAAKHRTAPSVRRVPSGRGHPSRPRRRPLPERAFHPNEYEQSLGEYARAIATARADVPGAEIPWYGKGATLILLGRYEEALRAIDTALDINPRNEVAWVNKGNALTRMGQLMDALRCFNAAIKVNPLFEVAW